MCPWLPDRGAPYDPMGPYSHPRASGRLGARGSRGIPSRLGAPGDLGAPSRASGPILGEILGTCLVLYHDAVPGMNCVYMIGDVPYIHSLVR